MKPEILDEDHVYLHDEAQPLVAYRDPERGWMLRPPVQVDLDLLERKRARERREHDDKTGTCRSCGAEVVWVTLLPKDPSKPGKPHPLDAKPIGRAAVRFGSTGRKARIVDTYASHFSTCPNAADHRTG